MFVSGFGDDYVVYTVKAGDTLDAIAKRYETTYQKIAETNMISDPNKIEVGQELMIYPMTNVIFVKPKSAKVPEPLPTISAKKAVDLVFPSQAATASKWINYALIGGIVALGVPLAIRYFNKPKAAEAR